ncbi:putative hydro-lyase [Helianthus annuus]|nr:putative hydro-lyase [Helianthus annuus]KAJ0884208.1 putative hydro-lyase [Helianthus annuus]
MVNSNEVSDYLNIITQAFDQCKKMLNELNVVKVNTEDTAGAAQDYSDNVTRFLILAREPIMPGTDKPHKTSIIFTLEEGPRVLFKALAVFALRDINLSKIESWPLRSRPLRIVDDSNKGSAKYFDYFFYIDFEASMAEPRAQYALRRLQVGLHSSYHIYSKGRMSYFQHVTYIWSNSGLTLVK